MVSLTFSTQNIKNTLPFNLSRESTFKIVNDKFGPYVREWEFDNISLYSYFYEEFMIEVYFDNSKKIDRMNISIPSYQFSLATDRLKGLRVIEGSKMDSKFIKGQLEIKRNKILRNWEEGLIDYIAEFEEELNEGSLNEEEEKFIENQTTIRKFLNKEFDILTLNFIDTVSRLTIEEIENETMELIRELILNFNQINKKHDSINTMEREDICIFINESLKLLGVQLHRNEDVTYQWRRW